MTVTRTSEAMSIIEEIKRDVRHEDDCSLEMDADARCTCSYRRKIAALDRDEELFTIALEILDGKRSIADWREWEERVRARTEEDLP